MGVGEPPAGADCKALGGGIARQSSRPSLKIAFVGAERPAGALAESFHRGAVQEGHESGLIGADRLVAGWRPLILSRRWRIESLTAGPLLKHLEGELGRFDPDLVVIVKGRFIPGRWIEQQRQRLGCPILNYYPDDPTWHGHSEPEVLRALQSYDEVLVWAPHVAEGLRRAAVSRVRVIPFGYDPDLYRPPDRTVTRAWEAVLIGQCYDARIPYAEALADRRILVSGKNWKRYTRGRNVQQHVHEAVYANSEICRIYWASAVALNILHDQNLQAHNMRTFEVPASGTAMVATRTPEHERLFGEDAAVLVDNPTEARAAVLRLNRDDDYQRLIAGNGHARIATHTYARRMAELIEPWLNRRATRPDTQADRNKSRPGLEG